MSEYIAVQAEFENVSRELWIRIKKLAKKYLGDDCGDIAFAYHPQDRVGYINHTANPRAVDEEAFVEECAKLGCRGIVRVKPSYRDASTEYHVSDNSSVAIITHAGVDPLDAFRIAAELVNRICMRYPELRNDRKALEEIRDAVLSEHKILVETRPAPPAPSPPRRRNRSKTITVGQ